MSCNRRYDLAIAYVANDHLSHSALPLRIGILCGLEIAIMGSDYCKTLSDVNFDEAVRAHECKLLARILFIEDLARKERKQQQRRFMRWIVYDPVGRLSSL